MGEDGEGGGNRVGEGKRKVSEEDIMCLLRLLYFYTRYFYRTMFSPCCFLPPFTL